MSVRWLVVLTGFACSIAGVVYAEPSRPGLHWSRAENAADCVDPRTLAELVESYTGPVLVAPANADETIEGAIERTGSDTFRVRISVSVARGRPSGQRVLSLQAADCRKLDGTISLVIATTLNPDLGAAALPAQLSWLQPSETPPADELRAELESTPASPARSGLQPSAALSASAVDATPRSKEHSAAASPSGSAEAWELGIAATLGTGVVPQTNLGGMLTFARSFGPSFALAAQLRGNGSLDGYEVVPGHSVGVATFGGALLACTHAHIERGPGVQACLGPEVGFFRAHGEGFSAAHTVVRPVYGGLAKLELRYEIADKLSIIAAVFFSLGWRRPTVTYQDVQAQPLVFRSDVYSIQSALGLTRAF
jgi:hypothetical protein